MAWTNQIRMTAAEFTAANPVLLENYSGFETDTGKIKIWLQNGTGTSLKIQATKSAGTITPLVGSYYTVRRLPAASTGTFAA